MLTLDKLSKSYGGRTIFDNVSWSMPDDGGSAWSVSTAPARPRCCG